MRPHFQPTLLTISFSTSENNIAELWQSSCVGFGVTSLLCGLL